HSNLIHFTPIHLLHFTPFYSTSLHSTPFRLISRHFTSLLADLRECDKAPKQQTRSGRSCRLLSPPNDPFIPTFEGVGTKMAANHCATAGSLGPLADNVPVDQLNLVSTPWQPGTCRQHLSFSPIPSTEYRPFVLTHFGYCDLSTLSCHGSNRTHQSTVPLSAKRPYATGFHKTFGKTTTCDPFLPLPTSTGTSRVDLR
ncbi:unnamed protein product, partial [Protopolystoma xenopodis]